ncbi:MAG: ABC transporter substrate-binding protein [Gammaproteobacteria bacterium]
MHSPVMKILRAAAAVLGLLLAGAVAADDTQFATDPRLNDARKWRIAYYEGGPYVNYQDTLMATVRGLMKLGWIEAADLPAPPEDETNAALWQWLAGKAGSDYLEFVTDAYYSANWDEGVREALSRRIIERLSTAADIDVIIAMGTAAGRDLANDRHSVPTVVMSTTDPVAAGIVKSVEESGHAHVHAAIDPIRDERQVSIFHEATGFERLGVAYEDTVNGRSYAAMDVVERLSGSKHFEIVPCHTYSDVSDVDIAEQSVVSCFEQLATKVDAISTTEQGGVTRRTLPKLIEIANGRRIPTFSQTGASEVKVGVLMSLSRAAYRYVGEFHARTLAKIMNGAPPGRIGQVFQEPPKIAINLNTARAIGFTPPLMLLGAADEVFGDPTAAE